MDMQMGSMCTDDNMNRKIIRKIIKCDDRWL
jgi:hypothetical protein